MKLEAIRALIAAATPGPWKHYPQTNYGVPSTEGICRWYCEFSARETGVTALEAAQAHKFGSHNVDANMAFIAASRTLLPKLLAIAEAADALAVVLGDRVHNHLTANERHWHNELANCLTALESNT